MTHPNVRAMPEDFAENAAKMTRAELQRHYRAGQKTATRWLEELGPLRVRRPKTHMPDDFAACAPSLTMTELKDRYAVRHGRIQKWCKLAGITPRRSGLRPIPDDFAEVAPTMVKSALIRHYKAGWDSVERWLQESGAIPAEPVYAPPPSISRGFVFRGHAATPLARDLRLHTMFDQAADDLRRQRFVVYRCDQRGRADQKGDFWRLGNTLLTPDELLMRAQKYREKVA